MTEPIISKFLTFKAIKNRIPLSGVFELTPCCNFSCKMCYVRKSREEIALEGGEINADTWIEIGKRCRDEGMLFLLLTGGEPFLFKDFKRMYLELSKMGLMISINSNGSLIDEEVVNWLKVNPPARINITLYGGSRETYEKLCGNPEAYDKTINAIKLLKEAGISVRINTSMTQYNYNDLEKMYKVAEKNNTYIQTASYMFPPVRRNTAMKGKGDRLSPYEAAKIEVMSDKLRMPKDKFNERVMAIHQGVLKYGYENDDCGSIEGENLKCRAGSCSFWVNWKGKMTACGMFNEPCFNIFDKSIGECWDNIIEETKKMHTPKKCAGCSMKFACEVCAAVVICETGGLSDPPDYMCSMTKEKLRLYDLEYQKIMNEAGEKNEDKEGVH